MRPAQFPLFGISVPMECQITHRNQVEALGTSLLQEAWIAQLYKDLMDSLLRMLVFLGKKEGNIPSSDKVGIWTLLKIVLELKPETKDWRNEKGNRVLKSFFATFLQKIVEEHHVLKGIDKQEIEICFLQLPDLVHQNYLDVAIWKQAKRMGIMYQGSALTAKTRKLNIVWMSRVYTAVSVWPVLLLATKPSSGMSAFNLLRLL